LAVSLLAIAITTYFTVSINPSIEIRVLIVSCMWASFVFLSSFIYLARKTSRIAKVLEIDKRLKKYGLED
jgi:hypothetical protein